MNREEAIEVYNGLINTKIKEAFEFFAPELRELEDERIRKWLVELVKNTDTNHSNMKLSENCKLALAWLEKQKEPKHAPDDLQKSFEAGQASIVDNPEQYGLCKKPELVQQPPITYTYNSNSSRDERLKAALLALLNSDLIKVREGGYFTKQDLIEWVERIPTDKPAWSEEDEAMIKSILFVLESYVSKAECEQSPALTATYPTYYKEIDWLKSLRPVKQEWSKEDKRIIKGIIGKIDHDQTYGVSKDEMLNFLKKL